MSCTVSAFICKPDKCYTNKNYELNHRGEIIYIPSWVIGGITTSHGILKEVEIDGKMIYARVDCCTADLFDYWSYLGKKDYGINDPRRIVFCESEIIRPRDKNLSRYTKTKSYSSRKSLNSRYLISGQEPDRIQAFAAPLSEFLLFLNSLLSKALNGSYEDEPSGHEIKELKFFSSLIESLFCIDEDAHDSIIYLSCGASWFTYHGRKISHGRSLQKTDL